MQLAMTQRVRVLLELVEAGVDVGVGAEYVAAVDGAAAWGDGGDAVVGGGLAEGEAGEEREEDGGEVHFGGSGGGL